MPMFEPGDVIGGPEVGGPIGTRFGVSALGPKLGGVGVGGKTTPE